MAMIKFPIALSDIAEALGRHMLSRTEVTTNWHACVAVDESPRADSLLISLREDGATQDTIRVSTTSYRYVSWVKSHIFTQVLYAPDTPSCQPKTII